MRPGPPLTGRKILPQRHQLPGMLSRSGREKPPIYWVFPDGTGFADQPAWKLGRMTRQLSELCHAVCSWRRDRRAGRRQFTDFVERVLVECVPPPSTGFSAVDPFEIASPASASTSSAPASGFGAGSPISPATLNTLLAAQSQSSTGSTVRAPARPMHGRIFPRRSTATPDPATHRIGIILQFAGKDASATDESDVVLRSPAIVQRLRQEVSRPERDFSSKRHIDRCFCLSMIFSENR